MKMKVKTLFYFGEIGGQLLSQLYLNPKTLILMSTGGDLYATFAILDFLSERKVDVVVTGTCFSAAILILAAGKRRYATRRCRFFVHPHCLENGRSQDLREIRNEEGELARMEREYIAFLAKRTKRGAKWWEAAIRDESYFGAELALRIGLINKIL